MTEDYAKLKQEIDAIPTDLKEAFVPHIKEAFNALSRTADTVDRGYDWFENAAFNKRMDEYLTFMDKMSKEFNQAGGTNAQWNLLVPAINYGHYDRLYPEI